MCQEALANVRKHACAQSTTVRLGYDPDAVRLEVSDDGAGFHPDRVRGGRHVDRASSPGAGTQVNATVSA